MKVNILKDDVIFSRTNDIARRKTMQFSAKFIFLLAFLGEISGNFASPILLLSNNGPVTLGASVTFSASLENYSSAYSKLIFTFNDGSDTSKIWTTNKNVSLTKPYLANEYQQGDHSMTVTVEAYEIFFNIFIAKNVTVFHLSNELIGSLKAHRPNNTDDANEVAVGENTTFVVDLSDPSGFLANATFDYSWSVDGDRYQTPGNELTYNFKDAGTKEVVALVVVSFPDNSHRIGFFERELTVKVPINGVNITGNPFLHHGEILHLNVSCSGSSPFEYCWKILKSNDSGENFSCSQVTTSTTCNFRILHYFQNYGTYNIAIYISNDVKETKRIIEVMIYNVSTKPTLSTVIIPIVCSLLTMMIIAGGIAYFIQHRNQLAVEVANFDFVEESNVYGERTFFERIFDSIFCRTCSSDRLLCGTREDDPLLSNQDSPRI